MKEKCFSSLACSKKKYEFIDFIGIWKEVNILNNKMLHLCIIENSFHRRNW
jgi:hypothetical protein